jgi:hypothetical protein
MSLNLTQLKTLIRQKVKVVLGGPANTTRGEGLIKVLDALAEAIVSPPDAPPLTGAQMFPNLESGTGISITLTSKGKVLIANTVPATAAVAPPAAPTTGQVDDAADTFSFLPNPAYPAFAQYKVAGLPGVTGAVALDATNSYVQGNRIYVKVVGAVAKGGLAVYVAGSGPIPDGKPLLNADPFTGTGVVTPPPTTGDIVAPSVTFTVPAVGATLAPNTQVLLTATANDNVAVAGLTFTNGATGVVIGQGAKNGSVYTFPYTTPATAGPLSLVATATDAAGNSQSATVNVNVQATTTTTPTATTPDAPFPSYDPVTRVLTFTHALGTSELEYNRFGGTFTSYAPIQVDDSSHSAGEWKARVKAYAAGNRNASGTADSPAITAKTTVNHIPVVTAGNDITLAPGTTSVALMGTATDQDPGDQLTYAWRQITGPAGAGTATGIPGTSVNLLASNLAVGTYQFGFRATDDKGGQSVEAYVVVTVPAVGSAPGAPTVAFDATNRILTATHPLGTAELEYERNSGQWNAYAQIYVDDNAHNLGEWQFRTRAGTNRPAGNPAPSPAIARTNNGAVQIPADRTAKLALSDGSYAAAQLALQRIIDASTFTFPDGSMGIAPGTGNPYYRNRMWVRDALFTLKAGLPYFSLATLTSWVDKLLAAAAQDGNRVPDRIASPQAQLYSGTAIERTPFPGIKQSPMDNNLLAIETAWLIYKKAGNANYYVANKTKLEALYNALPKQNGLVYIPAHALGDYLTTQFFGFKDSEVETGYGLHGAAFQYRAALRLAEMAAAAGDNPTAQGWVDTAAAVKSFFNSSACGLWDANFQMYRSASLFGSEVHDIPGNALAVEVGLADDDKALAISQKLNATIDQWAFRGGVRHIMVSDEAKPGYSCYRYFVNNQGKVFQVYDDAGNIVDDPKNAGTSSPYREYQNGAYWYTFTREIYTVLALTNDAAAKQLLYDAVVCSVVDKDYGQDNVECFNLNDGFRCNQYCGSAAGIFSLLAGGASDPANVSADLARQIDVDQSYINSANVAVYPWQQSANYLPTGPNANFLKGYGLYIENGATDIAAYTVRLMSPQYLQWDSPKSSGLATMQMCLYTPGVMPPDEAWVDVPLNAGSALPHAVVGSSPQPYPPGRYNILTRVKPGQTASGIRDTMRLVPQL